MIPQWLDAGERFALEKPLRDILCYFTYKPGWKFSVRDGVLHVEATVVDAYDPEQTCPLRFETSLPYMPKGFDWQRWLFDIIMRMERHEAQEFFMVAGHRPYDPHA